VFLFLQDWQATSFHCCRSCIADRNVYYFPLLGFSVNVLSLLGLVLAIGLVVDDAIVVVEAVMHNIEHGMNRKKQRESDEGSRRASRDCTHSRSRVCTRCLCGRYHRKIVSAVAYHCNFRFVLAFNALTLSPALSAILLKPKKKSTGWLQRFFDGFNWVFDKFTLGYTGVAGIVARKSIRSLIIMGVILGVTGLLGRYTWWFRTGRDEGYYLVNILPDAASTERTDE
jgi:HAE1 family hydrophobic/amphiphilic exporter-1